jgi:hypothetical protein
MYCPVDLPLRKEDTTRSYKRFIASVTYFNRNYNCGCPCSDVNSRSYRRNKTEFSTFVVIISIILATQMAVTTANIMGDECDWFGR